MAPDANHTEVTRVLSATNHYEVLGVSRGAIARI